MNLDFSKLTAAVKSVADLAAAHASLHALAQDAKDIEVKVRDKIKAEYDSIAAAVEAKAQSELDSIAAALEAALGSTQPLTQAEAVGVTAVATALSAPVSPTQPAAPADDANAPVPDVAVGVVAAPHVPHVPQTVDEYNAMRAAGLL